MRTRRVRKQCSLCGHIFGDRETINQHMASKHPRPDQFCCAGPCKDCGKFTEWKAETMKKAHKKADEVGELCEDCLKKAGDSNANV